MIATLQRQHFPGFDLAFETEDETHQPFAHFWLTDGQVFGKAALVKAAVPPGTFLTLDDPRLIWYFCKHAGFAVVADGLRDDQGDLVTVLQRQSDL